MPISRNAAPQSPALMALAERQRTMASNEDPDVSLFLRGGGGGMRDGVGTPLEDIFNGYRLSSTQMKPRGVVQSPCIPAAHPSALVDLYRSGFDCEMLC